MTRIEHDDPVVRRRGRTFVHAAFMLFMAAFAIYPASFVHPDPKIVLTQSATALIVQLIMVLSIAMARSGRVTLAARTVAASLFVIFFAVMVAHGKLLNIVWHLSLCVIFVGFSERQRDIWVAAAVLFVFVVGHAVVFGPEPGQAGKLPSFLLLLFFLTIISYFQNTARNESIEALSHSLDLLRQQNDELVSAREQAEAASDAKSRLLNKVSHELRTPLHTIDGYASLVLEHVELEDELDADSIAGDVAHIQHAGAGLLHSIDNILAYSELERGASRANPSRVLLDQVFDEFDAQFRGQIVARGIGLVRDGDSGIELEVDRDMLQRILQNLMANALEFTREGSITLGARRIGPDVLVTVTDTGKGIALEDEQRIFEAFTQADDSVTRVHDGTGLGLTVCARFARAMGGTSARAHVRSCRPSARRSWTHSARWARPRRSSWSRAARRARRAARRRRRACRRPR